MNQGQQEAEKMQEATQSRHGEVLKTEALIDHREWRNWMDFSLEGAMGRLNFLLKPHGVRLGLLNDGSCDYLHLRAVSGPEQKNEMESET